MNLVDWCASYAKNASSILMQPTAYTHYKYTNKKVHNQNQIYIYYKQYQKKIQYLVADQSSKGSVY